ncbi:SdpI family protein [Gryllotalpicola daejeonensis]|uniref:SdpI family protein n=1 Tax=Gryllotalpicola daejeonensis TaxID=993087 RepID=UPI0031DB62AA
MADDSAGGLAILGWVFCALLAFVVLICTLASRGSIPLNSSVGLRLPALMRSDETWAAGHAAAIPAAWVGFTGGVASALTGLFFNPAYWGVVFFLVLSLVWAGVAGSRAARAVS